LKELIQAKFLRKLNTYVKHYKLINLYKRYSMTNKEKLEKEIRKRV